MRLWNVRNGECAIVAMTDGEVITSSGSKKAQAAKIESAIENFTEKEDAGKIWDIDLAESNCGILKIVSGTNLGLINIWADNTAELVETRRKEQADARERDTNIQVLIKAGRFNDAFKTAFELNRPKQMIEVVKESTWRGGRIAIAKFVKTTCGESDKNRLKLIHMIEEWQKTAKNCSLAYSLIEVIVRETGATNGLDTKRFETFAEKHMGRLSNLSQKCFIIDAILLASSAAVEHDEEPTKKARIE
jgi:hypothetical protein